MFKVIIKAFNVSFELVCQLSFTQYEWYEQVHPIIDSDTTRMQLRIRLIEGEQHDEHDNVTLSWCARYSSDGSIIDLENDYQDGLIQQMHWSSDGKIAHKTITKNP